MARGKVLRRLLPRPGQQPQAAASSGPAGAGGPVRLDGAAGSVYVLSARHDDLQLAFTLEVTSVIGTLDDNGMLAYRASLLDLMKSLTLDSRMHLR